MRWLVIAALVIGCRAQDTEKAPVPVSTPAVSTFGAPIGTGPMVTLADVVKSPGSYKGQPIITAGTVSRVCQERGCWLALKDGSGDAVVRMHGHSFFVPTTSMGKHARVQGQVMLMKDGHECDDMEAQNAKLEIDATGVELN